MVPGLQRRVCAVQEQFPGGVTNGNAWYPVYNGMQDWLYIATGCRALTLELSETKWPPAELLPVRSLADVPSSSSTLTPE